MFCTGVLPLNPVSGSVDSKRVTGLDLRRSDVLYKATRIPILTQTIRLLAGKVKCFAHFDF